VTVMAGCFVLWLVMMMMFARSFLDRGFFLTYSDFGLAEIWSGSLEKKQAKLSNFELDFTHWYNDKTGEHKESNNN
jgi:hypothetical protein